MNMSPSYPTGSLHSISQGCRTFGEEVMHIATARGTSCLVLPPMASEKPMTEPEKKLGKIFSTHRQARNGKTINFEGRVKTIR